MWPVAESGKMAPLLSRQPVTYRCALSSEWSFAHQESGNSTDEES